MINKTNVSLRQARQDCGLSATGGLRGVTEFSDRAGGGYTLKSLAGHVLCRSSKTTTGTFRSNVNPGSACRPNYSEANVSSANGDHRITLSYNGNHGSTGNHNSDNILAVLGGFSFCGTIPPGTNRYTRLAKYTLPGTGSQGSQELIGWPSGYFVGTPTYYVGYVGSSNQNYATPVDFDMDGTATPYVTYCLQVHATRSTSTMDITDCWIKAK